MTADETLIIAVMIGLPVGVGCWYAYENWRLRRSKRTGDIKHSFPMVAKMPKLDEPKPLLPKASFYDGGFVDGSNPIIDEGATIKPLWWKSIEPLPDHVRAEAMKQLWYHPGVAGPPPKEYNNVWEVFNDLDSGAISRADAHQAMSKLLATKKKTEQPEPEKPAPPPHARKLRLR